MIIPASTLALIKFGAEAIQTIAPMIAANNVERDSHGRPKGFNEFGNFMKTLSQGAGALSMGIGAYGKFMGLKAPATSGTGGTDGTGDALKAATDASKGQGGILGQLMNDKNFDPGDLARPFGDTGLGIGKAFTEQQGLGIGYSEMFGSNPYSR